MNYLQFKKNFSPALCFTTQQIIALEPDFQHNNLSRWVNKGLLIRLRKNWYTFPENLQMAGIHYYLARRIYQPSYISLETALAYYGLIPEAVREITCVTSQKTQRFENPFGIFDYRSLKPELFFGYQSIQQDEKRSILMAEPEKALLDLLYLNPFYDSPEAIEGLRLDCDICLEQVNLTRLQDYAKTYSNKALQQRSENLIKWIEQC
jgi:predicted transcriptional regulator of viral defense system